MRVDHPLFHEPYEVVPTLEERPISSSYRTRASGRDLGDTMPMWRVQTEGYQDGKGFLIGVVSFPGLEDSPDGEVISGGMNSKGVDSVAIGRQGSFLHWGFAASPTYLTDEAKLVFVNALHYIAKFRGQRAFVHKGENPTRAQADDMVWGLTDAGFAAWEGLIAEANAERPEGTRPTTWTRERLVGYVATKALQAKLGDDWEAYRTYFTENRPWLHPVDDGGYYPVLDVDEDAQALGVAVGDVGLLDRCVALLEQGEQVDVATRLLARYTAQGEHTPAEWRAWLDGNRGRLFFTEVGGFRYQVDQAGAAAPALEVEAPRRGKPVQWNAGVFPVAGEPGRVQLVVKARILAGWHIYAEVPPKEPYANTVFRLDLPAGVIADGDWTRPEAHPSLMGGAGLLEWTGDVEFTRTLTVGREAEIPAALHLAIDYQTCDVSMCFPPMTREFELDVRGR